MAEVLRAIRRCITIDDLRAAARRRLPRLVFDFIDGGARDETTLRDNRRAFDAWQLLPRVGVDVSQRRLATTLLGRSMALPLVLGPTGLAGLYRPRGEMLACRAATTAGIPFCLSTNSIASIEAVAADVPDSDRWFQLYPLRDRDLMTEMLRRAWEHGYRTLCFTVDLPIQGRRERDIRNGFTLPLRPTVRTGWDVLRRPAWLWGLARHPVSFGNFAPSAAGGATTIAQHVASLFDPSADWALIAKLRKGWDGPFVVKGVLHPDEPGPPCAPVPMPSSSPTMAAVSSTRSRAPAPPCRASWRRSRARPTSSWTVACGAAPTSSRPWRSERAPA